ncbi:hypothetical protein FAI40_07115 [Acetobacteraceae bacterium]|nr:hypothetical protein FAI40_07115 [Acetobacteraceae bacterium]
MGLLKLVNEEVSSEHKLDRLAIFHHIALLALLAGILGFTAFLHKKLEKRLRILEEKNPSEI